INARSPCCTSSARDAACSNSGRQPDTDSALARDIAKSRPARCIFASAWPTPAQCATLGFRGQMPSRKLMMPAGQRAQRLAAFIPERLRTDDAAAGEMRHEPEKKRQLIPGDALFIQRQD